MTSDPSRRRALAAALAVFTVAAVIRAVAAASIRFPVPQDAAYYLAAAQNLISGRGLTVDVLWSYVTPPLTLPHPAFDLWQPLASFGSAAVMLVAGPRLAPAQASSVLIGSLASVFTWALARDAASELGLPSARVASVALGAGLLVGATPLLVVQGAEPDSSAPFTLLALAACWLVPRAIDEHASARHWRMLLGASLGFGYLARQEAVYVLVGYLVLAWLQDGISGLRRAALPVGVAAIVVAPWFIRQATTWSTSPLGQLLENAWLVRGTDIFAWSDRPSLASHLAIGLPGLISLRWDAIADAVGLAAVTAFPAGVIGVATVAAWPRVLAPTGLRAVAIAVGLSLAIDVLVFPVASRSGLLAHGAGPGIVLLAITAAFGLDRLLAWLASVRHWRRPAAMLGPAVLLLLALPLSGLTVSLESERARSTAAGYAALANAATGWDVALGTPVVSDEPLWANLTLRRPALALPREEPESIVDLARRFGAAAIVVRVPANETFAAALASYRDPGGAVCFAPLPAPHSFAALAFTCATTLAESSVPPPILAGR